MFVILGSSITIGDYKADSWYRLNCVLSPNQILEIYPLVPHNGILFGNRFLAEIVMMQSSMEGRLLIQYDWAPPDRME